MTIVFDKFARTRPYLYHLTATENLDRIRQELILSSTAALLRATGNERLLRVRRREHHLIQLDRDQIVIRDQAPLHKGNAGLEDGFSFDDLVELLNRMVFFWPGTDAGPIDYGKRHFDRYEDEGPVILRARFEDLVEMNPGNPPLFCKYNSGSPRCNDGHPSPRSPDTFLPGHKAPFSNSSVVEVTFLDSVSLPENTEMANSPSGPWRPLTA